MWVFDGHLDLAMNALVYERDQTSDHAALRRREAPGVQDDRGRCMVSLPAMRRGDVRLCVATILARAKPWIDPCRSIARSSGDWPSPDMAHAMCHGQLAYYRLLEQRGQITILTDRDALAMHLELWDESPDDAPIGVILTMEGADGITEPAELDDWHAAGLRTLMLAHFGRSHYAHGTPSTDPTNTHDVDGPLTDLGRALLERMLALRMPLDLSHLSDQSFAEAAERYSGGAVYASHSSCRAIVSGNDHVHPMRMLDDAQIKTVVEADGVIGVPVFNAFLEPGYHRGSDPDGVPIDRLADHIDHICQLAGDAAHVAIGSDADGGFGAEHTPAGLESIADCCRIGDTLARRGYGDAQVAAVMHGNWVRFFTRHLPPR
ncbi:MAG: peptidase M19 [Planctomycetes bacterium]|nr:peptidase M19 [Planctomycetota bacterium]